MSTTRARAAKIAWSLAIVLASASAGILVDWQAPGIARYTRDWLMRGRGPLPVPEDIAIVAIDEPSMVRFGRFPVVAPGHRPHHRHAGRRPAQSDRARRPVHRPHHAGRRRQPGAFHRPRRKCSGGGAAHRFPGARRSSRWLQPLPAIERAAARVGHVNAQTELDGIVRQVAIRLADDTGRSYLAMAGGGRTDCRRHTRGRRHR